MKTVCECSFCQGVREAATFAVRLTERRIRDYPQEEKVSALVSAGLLFAREMRKLPRAHRTIVAQFVRALLREMAEGDAQ